MHSHLIGDIGSLGEALAGVSALAAVLYGGRQLAQARKLARERVVWSFLERMDTDSFRHRFAESREFVTVSEARRDDRWNRWVHMSLARKEDVVSPMNLFEELATIYNDGLADAQVTRRLLGGAALVFWREAEWFVRRCQVAEPQAYAEWDRMIAILQDLTPDFAGSGAPG